jgi:hypothetical protein
MRRSNSDRNRFAAPEGQANDQLRRLSDPIRLSRGRYTDGNELGVNQPTYNHPQQHQIGPFGISQPQYIHQQQGQTAQAPYIPQPHPQNPAHTYIGYTGNVPHPSVGHQVQQGQAFGSQPAQYQPYQAESYHNPNQFFPSMQDNSGLGFGIQQAAPTATQGGQTGHGNRGSSSRKRAADDDSDDDDDGEFADLFRPARKSRKKD